MLLFLPVAFGQLVDMSKQIILLMEKLFLWLFITCSLQYRESSIQDVVTQSTDLVHAVLGGTPNFPLSVLSPVVKKSLRWTEND